MPLMVKHQDHLSRTVSRVAIVIATVVALSLPGGYFGLSYQYEIGSMRTEAEFNAIQTTQYIVLTPDMWRFQVLRLNELIGKAHADTSLPEQRRILDAAQQVIVASEARLHAPVLSVRTPLYDAGKTVGYFEVSRSLRPLLERTLLVGALGLALGFAVYLALKLFPLRVLNRALDSLRQSEGLFSKAFHGNPDPVMISRARDGHILDVNESFTLLTGFTRAESLGRSAKDLALWLDEISLDETSLPAATPSRGAHGSVRNLERFLTTKNGERRNILMSAEMIEINDDICTLTVARDITEQKRAEQQMNYLASYDHLTGLPNRVLFRDRLASALLRSLRDENLVALFYLDLDRFKQINDSLGHPVGDELLKQVSARLHDCVRRYDTVAQASTRHEDLGTTVARLGGDEFTIVLDDIKHIDEITRVAQRILAAFSKPFNLAGREVFASASLGITVFPIDDDEIDNLIRNADAAMYRAKALGRNNFQFYTHNLNVNAEARLWLETALRQAQARNEFELFYQPKLDLRTHLVVGVEALLRWNSPEKGLVFPDTFISLLEETGLIVPVGAWVLRTACAQATAWRNAGLNLSVAVNLSARQFHDDDLLPTVEAALHESGLAPSQLELEVTESMLMEDNARSQATLAKIKQMGVHISMDDFGTGYSSLAYLKRFPLDTLKIDRSFVKDIGINQDDTSIVRAVITLAHSLRLTVVAEGVETLEQLEFLRDNLCEQAQGYFISRPTSAVAFEAWLAKNYGSPTHPAKAPLVF